MRNLGIALITAAFAATTLIGTAEARGFGDNDTSKYFGSGDRSTAGMELDMSKGTAQMPVGTGEHWISWLEFNSGDLAADSAFLAEVFGWDIQPYMEGYSMWMPSLDQGVLGCGLMQNPEMPQLASFYIYTPDIDAKLAEVEAAGGSTVMPKMPIAEDMPNIAMFTDPSGVMVGLVDAALPAEPVANPIGVGATGTPGHFCGLEVYQADFATTNAFYKGLFGWSMKPSMEEYLDFSPGAGIAGVFQGHTPDAPVMAYIWSEDVQATLDAVTAAGGTTFGEAMSMEGIASFGYFVGPGGLMLGLMGPAS